MQPCSDSLGIWVIVVGSASDLVRCGNFANIIGGCVDAEPIDFGGTAHRVYASGAELFSVCGGVKLACCGSDAGFAFFGSEVALLIHS